MKKRNLVLGTLLTLALAMVPAVAQNTSTQSPGDQAKSSMKSAGKSTANAAKDVGSAAKTGTEAAADKTAGKIDINSASKEDLMKLEGIGDTTADKIIAGRPYRSKRDLLTRKIVNRAAYNKISGKIVAHAPARPASTPAK